ncbi:hypothetical protein QH639_19580 [Lysinibacillus sp. 1 U-2021]|uniref:hypothetical protein n=1 Tax=Lysinibacillus sp. 1 U-2021 TaxID=3039426 RepID=UPI00247FB397|nr:hypothetical protein [Lysinibacillus sp. 1 U-2021]WGT38004.1 hypothetical protein QH639_19580 [Lysinibacillus sp. 1 U-2021]
MIKQEQYNILQRSSRILHIKLELLNKNDIVINILQGYSISGSINISAESTYRRNGSLSMYIKDNNLLPRPESNIWFNRKVRVFTGLEDYDGEIVWFKQGEFLIQNADLSKTLSDRTINFDLSDKMASIDGSQGGTLSHELEILPEGITVSEAIRSSLKGLAKVSVDDIKITDVDLLVPYEINMQPNSSVYELVDTLRKLYMDIDFYVNLDGYYIVERIKNRHFDPVVWDFSRQNMNLVISNSTKINFDNVKNSVYIWGRKNTLGETIKWVYKNKYIRDTTSERDNIKNQEKGDICTIKSSLQSFFWDGEWKELSFTVNPEFSIDLIGERICSITEDKIATIEQAALRAEYELKISDNLSETIDFTCVPIYGLDVNEKIKMYDEDIGINGYYLTKSVSLPLSHDGAMSISAIKLY